MSKIDKFPSTPVKAIRAEVMTVIFFGFSLYWIDSNRDINMTLYGILAASVLGHDVNAAWQFARKRGTAWMPKDATMPDTPDSVTTKSEATKPPSGGQPALPAPPQEPRLIEVPVATEARAKADD